jgi:hypothetical protein
MTRLRQHEPSCPWQCGRAVGAAGLVSLYRTAGRANRGAIGIGPADSLEGRFGFLVSHAEHLSEARGLCRFAEEEVLGHLISTVFVDITGIDVFRPCNVFRLACVK